MNENLPGCRVRKSVNEAENNVITPGACSGNTGYNCVVVLERCLCWKAWYWAACVIYWLKARKLHSSQINLDAGGQMANPVLQLFFLLAALLPFPDSLQITTIAVEFFHSLGSTYHVPSAGLGSKVAKIKKVQSLPWRSLWCGWAFSYWLVALLVPRLLTHYSQATSKSFVFLTPANES